MVPFRPSGDKPIYCSKCFEKTSSRSNSSQGNYIRSKHIDRQDQKSHKLYPAVCDNCGNNCEVPFKPTSDKPIYCSQCFGDKRSSNRRHTSGKPVQHSHLQTNPDVKNLEKKLTQLEEKVDKILSLLNPATKESLPENTLFEQLTQETVEKKPISSLKKASKKKTAKSKTTSK